MIIEDLYILYVIYLLLLYIYILKYVILGNNNIYIKIHKMYKCTNKHIYISYLIFHYILLI
jgi:hypothetical protein